MKSTNFIVLLFFFLPIISSAQIITVNGKDGNRKLVWDDFTGVPDPTSNYYAHTYWNINYKYSNVSFEGDAALLQNFKVEVKLNLEKTWIKKGKESNRLLEHEQGHFDIGVLAMMEFLDTVKQATFPRSNYREKIQLLFTNVMKKFREMGSRYDEETEHFNNIKNQKKWDLFFETELAKYSIK